MALPFVFGNLAVSSELAYAVLLLSMISFIMGFGREIMGAVRDLEGDRLRDGTTFPMLVGPQMSLLFAASLYVVAIILSIVPYAVVQEYEGDIGYLFFIVLCDILLMAATIRSIFDMSYLKQARNLTLLATLCGLLAFLIGALA